jgi:osmotically-inducible protein OsmY
MIPAFLLISLLVQGCDQPNRNKVHEGQLLNDRVLQQRVESALHRKGREFDHVHVHVTDGTVMLEGTAASPDIRSRAENVAQGIYGVDSLDDEIQVVQH